MLYRALGCLTLAVLLTLADRALSAEADAAAKRPLKALLVTGGCCHDYARQKLILTQGISARADVEWTVVHQGGTATNSRIELYENADWSRGYDVVVHNECFSDVKDPAWVETILKPHREGLPAVLIHCAMHCYRTGDNKWFEFVGLQSPGHGPHFGYVVENLRQDNPIMARMGDRWMVEKGELYHTIKFWPNCKPLAQARRQDNNEPQTVAWTNEYGKCKVFATSIGHYNETMVDPVYLDMVTRGLLWATGRLEDGNFRPTDDKANQSIRELLTAPVEQSALPGGKCCGDGNLVLGKLTKAKSEETGKKNFAKNAVDGDTRTRWCADGGGTDEWWQVDLDKPAHVKSVRIHWEVPDVAYRYQVQASADGQKWKTVVDQSANKMPRRVTPHEMDSPDTRYLRVLFLGSSNNTWGSFFEFEAYADKLPPLPAGFEK